MVSDLGRAWRALLAIAAAYIAFLLFAQFGFLRQVQRDLADTAQVRAVMAAMGVAGLAASLGTARLLGRIAATRLVRAGLAATAAVAAASVLCHVLPALLAVSAAVGASLGLLTVALAAALPEIAPPRALGLAAGLGTGAAYFVSNLPALFEADPDLRALFPAALAAAALLLAPRPAFTPAPSGERLGLVLLLAVFVVLIWLDSAAFAIVQATPELKAQTWGTAGQKLLQGGVHLLAAAGAGALLDAGLGLAVPLAAWVLFALAFPLLQQGGTAVAAAGPLYAAGISLYSTALVVAPSRQARGGLPPRWRAGLLFGVAGWLGSALGVGMAQDLGRIPGWFLGATGAVLAAVAATVWARPARRLLRLFGPALSLGGAGLAALLVDAAVPEPLDPAPLAAVPRGRRVYVEEGCIHCHSQYVRPGTHDVTWWGPSRPLDRAERPPLVGARRLGPDLTAVGNRRNEVWNEAHLRDPRQLNPGSRMPSYRHLFAGDGQRGRDLVAYLAWLGGDTSVERWELTGRAPVLPPPAAPSAARGAALFAAYCAVCHGAAGRGDGPLAAQLYDPWVDLHGPALHSLPPGLAGPARDQALARIVRHGLPPTSMPGHEWLTPQQVADLVAHVKTFRKESR